MQARGVGRAVTAHSTAIFYSAAAGNQAVEELARQSNSITPAAVINPREYPACLREAERALAAGVTCFRFFPGLHQYPFTAQLAGLREALVALRSAKLLHVDFEHAAVPLLAPDLGDVLAVPTLVSVKSDGLGLALAAARSLPQLLLDTSGLGATGAIDLAVKSVGPERVLFGSGAPLTSLGSAIMSVQYAELNDAERAAILEGNAARVLGGQ
jgi:predicted TIM-barrel fold metal-dependent hydrolase